MRRFPETGPDRFTVGMMADWIARVQQYGPRSDGIQLWDDDEVYMARVARTDLIVRYFVVPYERLVLIQRFDTG